MPIPSTFDGDTDPCTISDRWGIDPELASRLVRMADQIPWGLVIFSGARTEAHQDSLRAEGRPTADNDKSTHLSCPATGADVRFAVGAANLERRSRIEFGRAAAIAGLRWGGGGRMDETGIIPLDWNHLDLGPRRAA